MRFLWSPWKQLSPLTRGLLILFLLNGVAVSLLLFSFSGRIGSTSLGYARSYVVSRARPSDAGTDSWGPMTDALEHLHESPDVPLYSELFFDKHTKFQYPPSSLLLMNGIQAIPGMFPSRTAALLNHLSWLCVLVTALLTSALLYNGWFVRAREEPTPASRTDVLVLCSVVVLIALTFYPITRSFRLGQIQTLVTTLAAAALLAWQCGRKKAAGILIGLVCTIKPHWGLVLLWGWLRRQWGMAVAGTATAVGVVSVSVALYGFRHYVDYASVLSALSRHGESFYPNQSINGLVNRLLFNGNNLQWVSDSLPPFHPVVYGATLVSAALIVGTALLWRHRSTAGAGSTELALVMLSVTIAAPIAWEHHYGILLPIFAVLVPIALAKRVFGKWTVPYLVSAFFLASQRLDFTNNFAGTRLNVLQSHLLCAGLMVLVMLYVVQRKHGRGERRERATTSAATDGRSLRAT